MLGGIFGTRGPSRGFGRLTVSPGKKKKREGGPMADRVYKVIELIGTSTESWEKAAKTAVELASKTIRDLRIAEVTELDMQIVDGKVETYRAKVRVSFKYED
jgi:flavin-binding protein dodecin